MPSPQVWKDSFVLSCKSPDTWTSVLASDSHGLASSLSALKSSDLITFRKNYVGDPDIANKFPVMASVHCSA